MRWGITAAAPYMTPAKPPGEVTVEGGSGHWEDTLVAALVAMDECGDTTAGPPLQYGI